MHSPLLVPPTQLPFTVHQGDGQVVITLGRDASHHRGLAELSAIAWVRGIMVPLVVDLAQVQLLSSALIGWMFGMIHEGRLRRLVILHASLRVQAQIRQVGLTNFVTFQPGELAAATMPA
jgi:anti-anti-sigma regulatory factor